MSSKSRVLVDDHYGQPCIAKFHKGGGQATVFSYHPWWSRVAADHQIHIIDDDYVWLE
jgi:hypothetical protein